MTDQDTITCESTCESNQKIITSFLALLEAKNINDWIEL